MEEKIIDSDMARNSAPPHHDTARHTFTISQAVELFAHLGVPRSKRSVQRFCEQGHLDCVRIKGDRGDQFFINRESVERYAEELRQIEAVAALRDEARHDVPQHATARSSAPERDTPIVVADPVAGRAPQDTDAIERLRDENLNLRIDNRAKEIAIAELNRRMVEDRDRYVGAMQDMSYKLGVAETHLAQIEAPKGEGDTARQSAPERDTAEADAAVIETPQSPEIAIPAHQTDSPIPAPRPSFFGRLFR